MFQEREDERSEGVKAPSLWDRRRPLSSEQSWGCGVKHMRGHEVGEQGPSHGTLRDTVAIKTLPPAERKANAKCHALHSNFMWNTGFTSGGRIFRKNLREITAE